MGKIWIILSLVLVLGSCVDPLEVTYHTYVASFEGNVESNFLHTGETRSFTLSVVKEKQMNGYSTGQYTVIHPSLLELYLHDSSFELLNRQVISDTELSFDITVSKNESEYPRYGQLIIYDDQGKEVFFHSLNQDPGNVNREYRMVSKQNPFVIPVEGGLFSVDFQIQSREIVDGEPREWRSTDYGGMKYRYHCTAASHHELQVRQHGVGQYSFILSAGPYYMESGREFNWRFSLFIEESDFSFVQVFLHEPDPSLKDSGADPATGYVSDYGYLRDVVL